MKKSLLIYCLSGLIALVGLTGCEDDSKKPFVPAEVGDEIKFGASANENAVVRTVYDETPIADATGKVYYRVSWEDDGSDQIAIYCPEAQGKTLCNYSVMPATDDPTKSSTVTKVNADETGLLWGESDPHHFYGFYPASAVTGTENGKIRGHIPVLQNPTGWNYVSNNKGGRNIYGTANTDYAFMWAYGRFNRIDQPEYEIPLTFHPWVTILEIKVPGPSGNTTMKVSAVNVEATEGSSTVLSGDFICDMTPVTSSEGEGQPVYEAVGNQGTVRNLITISCFNNKLGQDSDGDGQPDGDYVELGQNDTLVVRAYLLPYDQTIDSRTLQVRVSPVNRGVLTRTLRDPQSEGGVVPHKVNTVILPRLSDIGGNNWLSSLDPDVYLSELSIPGSYNSRNIGNNNNNYQTEDIDAQFDAGARAFMVGTYTDYTGWWSSRDYYLTLDDQSTRFTSLLSDLRRKLDELPEGSNEFVFLQISSSAGLDETWMQTVAEELNDIKNAGANNQYGVYTEEITRNTRIADVRGKIILKFNTNINDDGVTYDNDYFNANDDYPALFTRWVGAEPATTPMRWGSPNTLNTANLTWFFQEIDNVSDVGAQTKINYIYQLFEESISMYENGDAHDTWFFNCISGREGTDALSWTKKVSPQVTRYLQARTANASLGLVYMNHVNSDDSQNILQTIIDNNFKFELRKAGN